MNKELMLYLHDKVVKIDRGGPESRIGKVLTVEDDHIAVLTKEEGVVYYNTHHIKSLTDNVKKGLNVDFEIPGDFDYIKASDFKSVLNKLKYHWVQINRGGPEKLEGVLEEANDEFVTIIFNEEVIRLSMFHVRSISYGAKVEKVEAKEDKEKNDDKQDKEANEEK